MLKKLLPIILMAAACATATAAPLTYNFSYTGAMLDVPWGGDWEPGYKLLGSFHGEDKDHNGIIDQREIDTFLVAGDSSCNLTCEDVTLSYNLLTKQLKFYAGYSFYVDREYWGGWTFSEEGEYSYVGMNDYRAHHFTPDTVFAITAVPEPATYAMMSSGLLALALMQRRRKKSA